MRTICSLMCTLFAILFPPSTFANDFLEKDITGTRDVYIYRLKYKAGTGSPKAGPLDLSTHCEGTVEPFRFAELIEEAFASNSYGKLILNVTMGPPLEMPQPRSFYDSSCGDNLIRVLKDARATSGINYQNYDYEVVLTPGFWGTGPQGGNGFNKNFRVSFCGGGGHKLLDLVLHEMGHGFKFEHASYWTGDPTSGDAGCLEEYGDNFDVMGQVDNSQANCERHFNLRHKIWAGWHPLVEVPMGVDPMDVAFPTVTKATVPANGVYDIRPVEDGTPFDPVPRGLRIPRNGEWTYYVTFRKHDPAANQQCSTGGSPCNGALITKSRDNNLRPDGNTVLLNTDYGVPTSCGSVGTQCPTGSDRWCSSILTKGEVFTDPNFYSTDDGITIEVLRVLANKIRVRITFASTTPVAIDELPKIDILSPSPGDILEGCIPITVTAFDPDAGSVHFSGISEIKITSAGTTKVFSSSSGGAETWNFNTESLHNGFHVIYIEASDTQSPPTVRRIRFRFLVDNANGIPCCTGNCPATGISPDSCP